MSKVSDAHYHVARLMALPDADAVLAGHRWPNEVDRWHELVACLFVASISLPDREVRRVVDLLGRLGLLDVADWAEAAKDGEGSERQGVQKRAWAVLTEENVDVEQGRRALAALEECARVLKSRHKGKLQVCLRALSESLLTSMMKEFEFTGWSQEATREALTLWLQNVANAPLPLDDEHVRRFCKTHNIARGDLVQAADDLDVNVALLDDLVQLRMAEADGAGKGSKDEAEV